MTWIINLLISFLKLIWKSIKTLFLATWKSLVGRISSFVSLIIFLFITGWFLAKFVKI